MLAEAVHSLADCGNQGLLLLGLARSKRPANSEYPLGHGREIYFWSFIVALMLFSMGGMLFSMGVIFSAYLISHIVQPSEISLPFKGRAGVGMGDFGVLVVSVRSHPPSNSPLEGGRVRSVSSCLGGRAEVSEVLNLITLQQGADVVIAIKARMAERVAAPALGAAINDCERALRAAFPQVRWIFFEPDVRA